MKRKNEGSVNFSQEGISWTQIFTCFVLAVVGLIGGLYQLTTYNYFQTDGIVTLAEVVDYYGTRTSEGIVVEYTVDNYQYQSRIGGTNAVGPAIAIAYDPINPGRVRLAEDSFPWLGFVVAGIFGLFAFLGALTKL